MHELGTNEMADARMTAAFNLEPQGRAGERIRKRSLAGMQVGT